MSQIKSGKTYSNPFKIRKSNPVEQGESNQVKHRENNQVRHGGQRVTSDFDDSAIIVYLMAQ